MTTLTMQSQDPVVKAWLRRVELGERPAWGLFLENHYFPPGNTTGVVSLIASRYEQGRRT